MVTDYTEDAMFVWEARIAHSRGGEGVKVLVRCMGLRLEWDIFFVISGKPPLFVCIMGLKNHVFIDFTICTGHNFHACTSIPTLFV